MAYQNDGEKQTVIVPITKRDGGPMRQFNLSTRGRAVCRRPGCDEQIDFNNPKNKRIKHIYLAHGAAYHGLCFHKLLRPLSKFYNFEFRVENDEEAMRYLGKLEALAELASE